MKSLFVAPFPSTVLTGGCRNGYTRHRCRSHSAYMTSELKRHNKTCILLLLVFRKAFFGKTTADIFYSLDFISSKVY